MGCRNGTRLGWPPQSGLVASQFPLMPSGLAIHVTLLRPSTRGYQAWLGPFVTSARRNWIMDDPPITRLSGSKRFESVLRTPIHWRRREGPPSITWNLVFSLFSTFLFLFASFFASFSPFHSSPSGSGPGSKERKVGRQLANDYVRTWSFRGIVWIAVSRSNGVEAGDIWKYTN